MLKSIQVVTHEASALVRTAGHLSAWLGLVLVAVVSLNVIGRYLFGMGSVALQETEWHLMAAGALMGMSYGLNQGGEVRVDIFYARFPPRIQAWVELCSTALLIVIAGIIAWLSVAYVQSSYVIGEGSPDPGGLDHRFLLKALIPLGFTLLAIQGVAMMGRAILGLLTPLQRGKQDRADNAIH
ncbi:TRAP transporter small permease subunit [Aliiroseovarius sp. PTFE2010]|uniref:TRAP transporter small permease subunit n=1 Tax=Aliiroseovarius sp. PTFE2010 TaxID=3417190 RepID=UPI003CFA5F8C